MKAVVQRVAHARVTVGDRVAGEIGPGLVVLVGVARDDTAVEAAWLAAKVADLRIFSDNEGKMNRSLLESGGDALVVSQFTLYGDTRKGRRPSFVAAARGPEAEALFDEVVTQLEAKGIRCATGEFGAMMDVELVNRGPVTILVETPREPR